MDHPFRPLFVEHPPERMEELRAMGRPPRGLACDSLAGLIREFYKPLVKSIAYGHRAARTDTGSG